MKTLKLLPAVITVLGGLSYFSNAVPLAMTEAKITANAAFAEFQESNAHAIVQRTSGVSQVKLCQDSGFSDCSSWIDAKDSQCLGIWDNVSSVQYPKDGVQSCAFFRKDNCDPSDGQFTSTSSVTALPFGWDDIMKSYKCQWLDVEKRDGLEEVSTSLITREPDSLDQRDIVRVGFCVERAYLGLCKVWENDGEQGCTNIDLPGGVSSIIMPDPAHVRCTFFSNWGCGRTSTGFDDSESIPDLGEFTDPNPLSICTTKGCYNKRVTAFSCTRFAGKRAIEGLSLDVSSSAVTQVVPSLMSRDITPRQDNQNHPNIIGYIMLCSEPKFEGVCEVVTAPPYEKCTNFSSSNPTFKQVSAIRSWSFATGWGLACFFYENFGCPEGSNKFWQVYEKPDLSTWPDPNTGFGGGYWNDKILSYKCNVIYLGDPRPPKRDLSKIESSELVPRDDQGRIWFYDDPNLQGDFTWLSFYDGTCITIYDTTTQPVQSKVSSFRIVMAWNPDFSGTNCTFYTTGGCGQSAKFYTTDNRIEDLTNIDNGTFDDKIVSFNCIRLLNLDPPVAQEHAGNAPAPLERRQNFGVYNLFYKDPDYTGDNLNQTFRQNTCTTISQAFQDKISSMRITPDIFSGVSCRMYKELGCTGDFFYALTGGYPNFGNDPETHAFDDSLSSFICGAAALEVRESKDIELGTFEVCTDAYQKGACQTVNPTEKTCYNVDHPREASSLYLGYNELVGIFDMWCNLFEGANCVGLIGTVSTADTFGAGDLATWQGGKYNNRIFSFSCQQTAPMKLALRGDLEQSPRSLAISTTVPEGLEERRKVPALDVNDNTRPLSSTAASNDFTLLQPLHLLLRHPTDTANVSFCDDKPLAQGCRNYTVPVDICVRQTQPNITAVIPQDRYKCILFKDNRCAGSNSYTVNKPDFIFGGKQNGKWQNDFWFKCEHKNATDPPPLSSSGSTDVDLATRDTAEIIAVKFCDAIGLQGTCREYDVTAGDESCHHPIPSVSSYTIPQYYKCLMWRNPTCFDDPTRSNQGYAAMFDERDLTVFDDGSWNGVIVGFRCMHKKCADENGPGDPDSGC